MRIRILLALCPLLLLLSCDGQSNAAKGKKAAGQFHYSTADVVPPAGPASAARLPVDIYLDGTYSMQGFARPQPTNFSRLLEGVVAAVQNTAKSSDLRFFKYGRSVAPLTRGGFVGAGTDSTLWSDKDFRSKTDFAQAVDSINPARISIFITDLFYSEGDAQNVVGAIQDNGFQKGISLGLLGLQSDFNGYVADLAPTWKEAVPVRGTRPLYVLVLGSKANIQLILGALRSQSYVQSDQALLLTPYPVKRFTATAAKDPRSRAINNNLSGRKQAAEVGNVFAFNWNPDKGSEGTVDYTLTYEPEPYTLPVAPNSLKARLFRKGTNAPDSVADEQSLRLAPGAAQPHQLTGKATATLSLPANNDYVEYQITWQYDNLTAPTLPAWITANSTATFTRSSPPADRLKTYRLDDFVRSLAVNSATQFEPKYGKLYLVFIRK